MLFNKLLTEELKVFSGLKPAADRFNGVATVNWFSMANYGKALGILDIGVGGTGTTTVTVKAASDSTGSNAEAIAFKRRRIAAASDLMGVVTDTASTGFTTTAGGGDMYLIEVDAANLPDGKHYVQFYLSEAVNSPVYGSLIVLLGGCRYAGANLPTAVAATGLASPSVSNSPSSSPSASVSASPSAS